MSAESPVFVPPTTPDEVLTSFYERLENPESYAETFHPMTTALRESYIAPYGIAARAELVGHGVLAFGRFADETITGLPWMAGPDTAAMDAYGVRHHEFSKELTDVSARVGFRKVDTQQDQMSDGWPVYILPDFKRGRYHLVQTSESKLYSEQAHEAAERASASWPNITVYGTKPLDEGQEIGFRISAGDTQYASLYANPSLNSRLLAQAIFR